MAITVKKKMIREHHDVTSLEDFLLNFSQNILQDITDPLSVIDSRFRIIWGNRCKALEHGIKQKDMRGKICYEIFFHRSKPCRECAVKEVLKIGKPCLIKKHCKLPDARPLWCEQRAVPVFDENHNIAHIIVYGVDITDIKLQQEIQKKYIETLEKKILQVNQGNSKLLSNACPNYSEPLTERELEVLRLMSAGLTNPEISKTLSISKHTAKSHVINIFNKLGVKNRTQAAVIAAMQHLIPYLTPLNVK
jgi:DNA-binding CsgD family transcriptional regulator